jgi:putative addiction module antidote
MHKLTLTAIGNSTGLIIPKEILNRLNISKGDEVYVTETRDGLHLTVQNESFAKQMRAAESIMKRYKNALGELAK